MLWIWHPHPQIDFISPMSPGHQYFLKSPRCFRCAVSLKLLVLLVFETNKEASKEIRVGYNSGFDVLRRCRKQR